jgi:4-amino-4-deoxy-L-arabinose transferase-like glycosyltransferase
MLGRRVPAIHRRVPAAAWACAFVACVNAASWSFITPPLAATDEPSHFAYVKQLADTSSLPTNSSSAFSREEQFALTALRAWDIRYDTAAQAIFSNREQDTLVEGLEHFERLPESRGSPAAGVATSEPPLYYALLSIPYRLGASGTLLERLQLMRLLSALFAGCTALFAFLFLREALPRVRWAWTVGALGVALSPLFAFMSGAVNPDALLFAVSAALFYCLARAFRRGLGARWAVVTGLVIAAGLLSKLTFIGLVPGALLGLCVLAVRGARRSGPRAVVPPVLAAAIGCLPVLGFVIRNALRGRSAFGIVEGTIGTTGGSALEGANYVWQLFLPRLPGTPNDFPGVFPSRQIWFDGYVGRLGWLDTFFPNWVYTAALVLATVLAVLLLRALVARRGALRGRLPELVVYGTIALGLVLVIGGTSYRSFPGAAAEYGQTRYLLPLLPLLGAVLALAARGAGRRWGASVGALMVVLFFAHDLFSQLQMVARYYG